MISYEIISVSPTLKLKEAAVGVGGLYGSVYLNDRFEKLVQQRIGAVFVTVFPVSRLGVRTLVTESHNYRAFNKMTPQGKEEMMSYFDTCLKKTFSTPRIEGDDNSDDEDGLDDFPCPVPGVPDNQDAGVITESLMLAREDVQSIFDPIFEKIAMMVQEQVDEAELNVQRPVTVG